MQCDLFGWRLDVPVQIWNGCKRELCSKEGYDDNMDCIVEYIFFLSQILYKDSEHSAAVQQQQKQAGKVDEGTVVTCVN